MFMSRTPLDKFMKFSDPVSESTVNPGVTRDVILPILEKATGMKVGVDFYLAHCPERIDPGNDHFYVGNLNRVVGGITDSCAEKAVSFYSDVIDAKIIPLGSSEEAEFVKSWENSHRNVLTALANSAAVICDGLDLRAVEGIIKPLPGLLVAPKGGKRFFLEAADSQHLFFIRKRIRKYIENYESNEWEWEVYPDVYIIRIRSHKAT